MLTCVDRLIDRFIMFSMKVFASFETVVIN